MAFVEQVYYQLELNRVSLDPPPVSDLISSRGSQTAEKNIQQIWFSETVKTNKRTKNAQASTRFIYANDKWLVSSENKSVFNFLFICESRELLKGSSGWYQKTVSARS